MPAPYHIESEQFTGPFDLLLHLIENEEVDVYNVSIRKITDQYLAHIEQMRENQLEVGSEFLVMAATLLEIKSNSLLPRDIQEELIEIPDELRLSLLDRLVEYKQVKKAAEALAEHEIEAQKRFYRDQAIAGEIAAEQVTPRWIFSGAQTQKLIAAFEAVWKRRFLDKEEPHEIAADVVTVRDKISNILDRLGTTRYITFDDCIEGATTRIEFIVTFIAVLEVNRRQLAFVYQDHQYDEIRIERAWGDRAPLAIQEIPK